MDGELVDMTAIAVVTLPGLFVFWRGPSSSRRRLRLTLDPGLVRFSSFFSYVSMATSSVTSNIGSIL